MYLATTFSGDGLRNFNSRCGQGKSLQQCLRDLASTRKLIRDDILDMQLGTGGASYRFNKPMRYIQSDYDIYLLNVEDGVLQQQPVSVGWFFIVVFILFYGEGLCGFTCFAKYEQFFCHEPRFSAPPKKIKRES